MKKKLAAKLALIALTLASVVAIAPNVNADVDAPCVCSSGKNQGMTVKTGKCSVATCGDGYVDEKPLTNTFSNIINVIIGIVGFITILMIIIGGIMYATSSGDSGKAKKAKDTIMYGLIGLVIALLAFAIVNFVMGKV